MAELLWHPAVMAKVRDELWDTLGSKPHPDESVLAAEEGNGEIWNQR
jgi:hypothetical protein